jgi:hypothetical protein
MEQIKSKTLVELIDFIVSSKMNGDITDFAVKNNYNHHVEELACRLSVNKISAIIFSYVFFKSIRGSYPEKYEIVTDVINFNTSDIYISIQELIKNNLIKYFRNHPRKPHLCFFTTEDLDKLIVANISPFKITKSTLAKSVISVLPFENGHDYWICLNNNKIGVVYNHITDNSNYTAVIDFTVINADTIDEIIDKLNQLLKENKLKIP